MAVKKKLIALAAVLCLILCSCGGGGSSEDNTPGDVAKVRDRSMKAVQQTAHEIEGAWVDRVTNLENYSENADARDTAEYVSMRGDLQDYAKEYKADRMYIMAPGEDTEYLLVIDTDEPGGSWHNKEVVDSTACGKAFKSGLVAAEQMGRKIGDKYYWSAYCPLYDSNGKIVYVIAADVSSEKLADYPDWIAE